MKNNFISSTFAYFYSFCVCVLLTSNVFGCECNGPSICTAYSRAKSVFIGKLEKVENVIEDREKVEKATFIVEKTFKGKTEAVEQMSFLISDCERELVVGETYLVYKEDNIFFTPCNRTDILSRLPFHLKYLESLSETNPIFTINVVILGLAEEDLVESQIIIKNEKNEFVSNLDKTNGFSFVAREKGRYRVKLSFPFEATVNFFNPKLIKVSSNPSLTTIEYDLEFKNNECNDKEFTVFKKEKVSLFDVIKESRFTIANTESELCNENYFPNLMAF